MPNAQTSEAQVHRISPTVSWWLERESDGWHWFVAGENWLKRSAHPFPFAYAAQRDALALLGAA